MFPEKITISGREVPLHVRRSKRAKTIQLRICPKEPAVILVYPFRASIKRAKAFLESKETWVAQHVAALPQRLPFVHGQVVPVLGKPLTIQHIPQTRGVAHIQENQLIIPCLEEFLARRVDDFLVKILRKEAEQLANKKSRQLGVVYQKITIRDMASRWGSCSAEGNLNFSKSLVFAPYEVLDYLVAHEVVHLKEMNHSRRFWKLVEILCPGYKEHRLWLKQYGDTLHRYGGKNCSV